jgi:hypothetical protein
MVRTESASSRIRSHFASGKSLTPLQALGVFGAYRLADVVLKMRQKNRPVITTLRTDANGKTYAEYREAQKGDILVVTEDYPWAAAVAAGDRVTFQSVDDLYDGELHVTCSKGIDWIVGTQHVRFP